MQGFRIARCAHIKDLTGEGARIHGGRWNPKGVSVVYASESRALATAEYLVHLPLALAPQDLCIAVITLPDKVSSETIQVDDLPSDWRTYPAPEQLSDLGGRWVREQRSLILRVPSVVVQGDFNLLINPAHPEMKRVRLHSTARYEMDRRLLRSH